MSRDTSLPAVILCLTGPSLTLDMVERFSLVIPGAISAIDWVTQGHAVRITCSDGIPPEIIPAMTDIALARGWDLVVLPSVLPHGQTEEIL